MKTFTKFFIAAILAIPGLMFAQVPTVTYTATPSTSVCACGSINFTNTSTNSPTSWTWYFPGGTPNYYNTSVPSGNPPPIQYCDSGSYLVSCVVVNGSGRDSNTKTNYIHVYSPPHVVITGPAVLCDGNSAEVCASGGTQYMWNTGATTSCFSIGAIVGIAGLTYTVQVRNGACFKDTSYTVNFDTCLGIPNISAQPAISIFPNPTGSFLSISIEKPMGEGSSLSVLDITGRELIAKTISQNQSQLNIDVSSLAPSIYFLKLQTDVGLIVKKFVKK